MKIQGKIRGDMVGFSLKHNPDNGARFAYVRIAYRATREQLVKLFGDVLELVAFGSLQVSEPTDAEKVAASEGEDKDAAKGSVSFGYKKITPDAVCEYHEVKILGHTQKVQPVIKSITPVKDEEKVTIEIELPILIAKDKALAGSLCAEFGELVDVELNPAQRELPLTSIQGGAQPGVVIKKGRFGNPEPVASGG